MGTVFQFLLTVTSHFGVLVVEEMVFKRGTQLLRELITNGCHKERRHIIAGFLTRQISLDFLCH